MLKDVTNIICIYYIIFYIYTHTEIFIKMKNNESNKYSLEISFLSYFDVHTKLLILKASVMTYIMTFPVFIHDITSITIFSPISIHYTITLEVIPSVHPSL